MAHPARTPHPHPGLFIAFEGVDGVGKSTQAALLAARLRSAGRSVVEVATPGTTPLGVAARDLLKHGSDDIDSWANLLIHMAVQADVARRVIRPALALGSVVVCDRFVDTSIAYAGGGYRLGMWKVAKVHDLSCGLWPDLTILLDGPAHRALGDDRYEREGADFWALVRSAYKVLAATYRSVARVAPGTPSEVAGSVLENVHRAESKLCQSVRL